MKDYRHSHERRAWFSGQCWISKQEFVYQLVHWDPKYEKRSRSKPERNIINQLINDIGIRKGRSG